MTREVNENKKSNNKVNSEPQREFKRANSNKQKQNLDKEKSRWISCFVYFL